MYQFNDRYFLCKHIGEGGFGTVFRGKKRDTSEIVAIKVCEAAFYIFLPSNYIYFLCMEVIDPEEDDVFRVSQEIANVQGKVCLSHVHIFLAAIFSTLSLRLCLNSFPCTIAW